MLWDVMMVIVMVEKGSQPLFFCVGGASAPERLPLAPGLLTFIRHPHFIRIEKCAQRVAFDVSVRAFELTHCFH
jgi:hypothetical protein